MGVFEHYVVLSLFCILVPCCYHCAVSIYFGFGDNLSGAVFWLDTPQNWPGPNVWLPAFSECSPGLVSHPRSAPGFGRTLLSLGGLASIARTCSGWIRGGGVRHGDGGRGIRRSIAHHKQLFNQLKCHTILVSSSADLLALSVTELMYFSNPTVQCVNNSKHVV